MVGKVSIHDDDKVAGCKLKPMDVCRSCHYKQRISQTIKQHAITKMPYPNQAFQNEVSGADKACGKVSEIREMD